MILRDVPIFAECRRLNPHTGEWDVYDRAWCEAAVASFQQFAVKGFLTTVTLGHHMRADESPELLGYVEEMRVEDRDGKAYIVATLDIEPPPCPMLFVAVEVNDPSKAAISSVALVQGPSFFGFPPITFS